MFGYRPESACLTRTFTSLTMHARRRTIPAFAGMTNGGRNELFRQSRKRGSRSPCETWIPAFAGMTIGVRNELFRQSRKPESSPLRQETADALEVRPTSRHLLQSAIHPRSRCRGTLDVSTDTTSHPAPCAHGGWRFSLRSHFSAGPLGCDQQSPLLTVTALATKGEVMARSSAL